MHAHTRSRGAAALVAALLAVAGLTVAGASPAAAAGPTVTLVGHGWGHGYGMGQYGAYGYVVDQGWTSGMVLDHFYGGTTAGTIPDISMSVALTGVSSATWVTSGGGFSIGDPSTSAGRVHIAAGSAARIVRNGSWWQVYTRFNGCAGTDSFGPFSVSGSSIWLDADPGGSGSAAQLLTTCSTGTAYRGSLRGAWTGAAVQLVNDLPMEQYLRSVTPSESIPSWGDARGGWGGQVLQAQAVAARSFAASQNRYSYAKTCDTDSCQVYPGAYRGGTPVEDRRTDAAVSSTAGVIRRTATGAVAETQFSASSGGYTTGGAYSSVADEGDSRSPYHTWVAQLDGSTLADSYGVGTFRQLLVTQQQPGGPGGGRALQVQVLGSAGAVTVSATSFRSRWGLRSDWFFPVQQPVQETTSTAYVSNAYSDVVYRQSCLSWNRWCDHAPMTYAEYVAVGSPRPTAVPTDYVKYPWSATLYAVTYWPSEPSWQWHQLTYAEWVSAGRPAPRTAGFVYGTMYYTVGTSPVVYANGPDNVVHALGYDEWRAAGSPVPVRR